ncbi:polynucleotide adenylyltransferase [Deltaproteobacteria bacterium TL4]
MMKLNKEVIQIAKAFSEVGGKAILVGGSVRDHFLEGHLAKDLDIEVYHLSLEQLESVLAQFGKVYAVGKSFGVLKLSTKVADYDVSFPRRENKIGKGHKGFIVETDSQMTFEEAASRRDFTINAMGYDILEEKLLDPFKGQSDLKHKILRHIGPSFSEDPLRVLRAMQFAGRFELNVAPETIELAQQLELSELACERIFEEFKKLLLKAKRPSLGLEAAKRMNVLDYFPELKALVGVPQDPEWHPEGDVWQHNQLVIDEAALLRQNDEKKDLAMMFGALCHDFGKPGTTEFMEGRWRSYKHELLGQEPAELFLRRLTKEQELIELVKIYVTEHLKPAHLFKDKENVKDGTIRRLSLKVSIADLLQVAQADHFGRTTSDALARSFPAGAWLRARAEALKVQDSAPKPFLRGRHLLELGMKPGPQMGQLLKEAFEQQLEGQLNSLEQALTWAKEILI